MNDGPAQDLAALELLWGLRKAPTFGPRRALTLRQIAGVCVQLADTEGTGAISMQRVAQELNFTKMSLYRYVKNKAEMLALMTDLAVGRPPDLGPAEDGWRIRLDRLARGIHATWQHHPWLPHVSEWQGSPGAVRPINPVRAMGPNEVGWVEVGVATLDGTPLSARERMECVFLVSAHLRSTHAMTSSGVLPWTLGLPPDPVLDSLRDERESSYPALAGIAAAAPEPDHDPLTFGLERVLDGIELLITTRTRATNHRASITAGIVQRGRRP